MEFRANAVTNNGDIPDSIPVAQTANIDIPMAQPVIEVLTWDVQLENFLKKGSMRLNESFKQKITDFSFENHWTESQPKKGCKLAEGSFTLTYTYLDIYVKIEAKYNSILTPKHRGVPTIIRKLTLSGTFDDAALLTWNSFRCDNCRDATHPLWFILKLHRGLCTTWWYLMKLN